MNTFNVEILPDGKIKITSPGGFSREQHKDADEFIDLVRALAGGDMETRQLPKESIGQIQSATQRGRV